MFRRHSRLVGYLVISTLLLASIPAFAADWDSFPELEGRQHVAIKKRFDGPLYDDLRRCYRRFDSRVGAEYFAAMVDVTDESGSRSRKKNDAGPYAQALFEEWKKGPELEGDDGILIVLGLRNRSVAVHPGSKWTKIGFEGEVIEETIEASHFPKLHRRRNYVDALCSLVTDIDLRLAELQREMKENIAALEKRLPDLDKKLTALDDKVSARFEGDHPYGDKLLSRLAAARTKLDEAKSLAEDKPTEAVDLADEVEAVLQPVRADLERFNQDMTQLASFEEELAALQTTIEARPDLEWEEPQAALVQLAKCEQMVADIRQNYEKRPWHVRDCQRKAEAHLARADAHYFYLRTVLPAVAIGLLVVLLAGFVIARRLRRRRALAALEPDLAEWRRRLDNAAKRLDGLAQTCPAYFAAGRSAWDGESAELDRQVGAATNRMALLLREGRELLAEAETLRDKSHPLDAKRLEKALETLRETPVTLDDSYVGTASELLADVDTAYIQARERLDEVTETSERVTTSAARANDTVAQASYAVQQRRDLGLPAEHLSEPLEAATAAWNQATQLAAVDPVRAAKIFDEAADRLDEIARRADEGNEAVQRIQGPLAELGEELHQQTRQLRFARVDLSKLSFEPKQELESAKRRAVEIVDLVAKANEDEATEGLAALEADMSRLAERLDVIAEARDGVPERLAALDARSNDLKERLIEMRYTLRSLAKESDSQAFADESKRLGKYHARLNALAKRVATIEKHHASGRYFVASEKVGALERLFDAAESLLSELGHIDQDVDAARARAAELVEVCEPMVRGLQERVKQPGASPTLREVLAEQAVSFEMLRDQVRAEQADWLAARDELLALHKVLTFLGTEVDADLAAFERARQLAGKLAADLGALAPSSNQAREVIARAEQMLTGWSSQLEEGTGGGRTQLRTGQEVARACARAADIANGAQPVELAAAAQLAYARTRYDEVHGQPYGYGIGADCSTLTGDLDAATNALKSGAHAKALVRAEEVIEQIELEAARAASAAEREYRRARVSLLAHQQTARDVVSPASLGGSSSWAASVSTVDEAAAV